MFISHRPKYFEWALSFQTFGKSSIWLARFVVIWSNLMQENVWHCVNLNVRCTIGGLKTPPVAGVDSNLCCKVICGMHKSGTYEKESFVNLEASLSAICGGFYVLYSWKYKSNAAAKKTTNEWVTAAVTHCHLAATPQVCAQREHSPQWAVCHVWGGYISLVFYRFQ